MKRVSVPAIVPPLFATSAFALAGVWILFEGAQSAPAPLREFLMRGFDLAIEPSAKAIVAGFFALALICLFIRERWVALFAGAFLSFLALMSISRAFRDGEVSGSMVFGFTLGIATVILAMRSAPPATSSRGRLGLSSAWRVLAVVLSLALGASLAARLDFHREDRFTPPAQVIDMQLEKSVGQPLNSTLIATYLPTVQAMLAAGGNTGWVVFFNPHCSACHSFFDEHFQGPQAEPIIAVEIPLADGEVAAVGDDLGQISCTSCEFVELPKGPLWLVAPPAALRVENGIVTCYSDKISGDCFSAK